MIYTRKNYQEDLFEQISDDDFERLFACTKEQVEAGHWNQNLEISYCEYVVESGYEFE